MAPPRPCNGELGPHRPTCLTTCRHEAPPLCNAVANPRRRSTLAARPGQIMLVLLIDCSGLTRVGVCEDVREPLPAWRFARLEQVHLPGSDHVAQHPARITILSRPLHG